MVITSNGEGYNSTVILDSFRKKGNGEMEKVCDKHGIEFLWGTCCPECNFEKFSPREPIIETTPEPRLSIPIEHNDIPVEVKVKI